jgi:uncharacterized caspase-like protein
MNNARDFFPAWIVRLLGAALLCVPMIAFGASERVALLIGNNQYPGSPLRNAVNDARDLGDALKELGFKVIVRENTSRKEMIEAIREFGNALEGAQAALFFYAGHAMQFKDRNYLIPIDAAMGSEDDVTFFSVEVGQVFDRMDRARTRFNFLILDACRDNPFASSFKVSAAGLAQMSAPQGTIISYATAPGAVAQDGFGRNGTFTKYLLKHIRSPDVPVEIMFKRVREDVVQETRRQQSPWDSSSLKGDFTFNATGKALASAPAAAQSSGPSSDAQLAIEREFWISVRDSNRPDDIQAYLDKYPAGQFSALAKNRLEALIRPARAQVAAAPALEAKPTELAKPAVPASGSGAPETKPAPPSPAGSAPPKSEAAPAEKVVVAAVAPPPEAIPPKAAAPQQQVKELEGGTREVTFGDGSVYRGGVRGADLHGKGEFVSKSGFRYSGEFKDGLKHGQGTYVWQNGDKFTGDFADDKPNGKGLYEFASGDRYEGEVRDGVIVGKGAYSTKDGDRFEGLFTNGKPDGRGVYKFASGDRYEGEMLAGRVSGKGTYLSANGDRIEGLFVDGKPSIGIYHFSGGDRYEGDIAGGTLTGKGTYHYSNGLKYEGEMVLGKPNGRGVFWFTDGTRFDGTFEDGLKRAKGALIGKDGERHGAEIIDGTVRLSD